MLDRRLLLDFRARAPTVLGRPPQGCSTVEDRHARRPGLAEPSHQDHHRQRTSAKICDGPAGVPDGEYSYFRYPADLFDERLGEYTLIPTHMTGFFTLKELATGRMAGPFDFTKGQKLIRYDALNEARRPPGLDGTKFAAFESAVYHNATDPHQLHPIRDAAVEARLSAEILRILRAHDAPPEYFAWMGLDAPQGQG